MLNQRERATLQAAVEKIEALFDAETAAISLRSGRVAQAALERRDVYQDLLRQLKPLLRPCP